MLEHPYDLVVPGDGQYVLAIGCAGEKGYDRSIGHPRHLFFRGSVSLPTFALLLAVFFRRIARNHNVLFLRRSIISTSTFISLTLLPLRRRLTLFGALDLSLRLLCLPRFLSICNRLHCFCDFGHIWVLPC